MEESNNIVRLAAIGLGNRMGKYMMYVNANPDKVKLVAVADPNGLRREEYKEKYDLEDAACFATAEELLASPVGMDAVIIASPDRLHYDQSMAAVARGLHVLLEKPIAQTIVQCRNITRAAEEAGVIVNVCYVLRYLPFYKKISEIIASGVLGKVVSATHTIWVGQDRMTHSYVRGQFSQAATSCPLVLTKASHDVDLMLWLTGKKVVSLSSTGSLSRYRKENVPEGCGERCVSCPIEKDCPYSAVDLYKRRREWIANFDVPDGKTIDEVIDDVLAEGRHGRCVFKCDNDVVDNQRIVLDTADGLNMELIIDGLAVEEGRKTLIVCEKGSVETKGDVIVMKHDGREEVFDYTHDNALPFHAGTDLSVIGDLIESILDRKHNVRAPLAESLRSHEICFASEESRLEDGKTIVLHNII